MKFFVALVISKLTRLIIRLFGKIFKLNGSHFPGNVAIKICPDFLEKVGKPEKIITVTGTNGKTTTCNLLIDCLEKNGYKVLSNKHGSNIRGGVATTLLSGVNLLNKPKFNLAVLEVDERSSKYIYPCIKPSYCVVTNLFRDSLKRNAHSEFIFDIINDSLSRESTLILNADDLISNRLKPENGRVYFGVEKQLNDTHTQTFNIVNDAQICPNCYSKLKYDFIRYHHIGRAFCENCGYRSPKPDFTVEFTDFRNKKIIYSDGIVKTEVNMVSDSIFNIYNQIATITVLKQLGFTDEQVKQTFKDITITKERYIEEDVDGIKIINHLAKGQNPVACSIVFKYVKEEDENKEVILLIEDYHDNKESSENIAWLYDTDFEFLNDDTIEKIIVGGARANDIKFRLLLANVPKEKIVAVRDEKLIPEYLSYKKDNSIYILYDMYEQKIVDNVNKLIKQKIKSSGGDK